MSQHCVSMQSVYFSYPDGHCALDGIDVTIDYGQAVGIVGANGAGKSTVLLHFAGVLLPTSGLVRIGDCLVSRQSLLEVRRRVGFVFQDPDDQLFMPTVGEDVSFGPLNQGLAPEAVEVRVRTALEQVGIAHLRHRPPHRLSGGERRSASLATVLALDPEILLLDEPSANLDPASRRRLIGHLKAFAHTRIIASHDLDLVLAVCERTLILRHGKVFAEGSTRQLLGNRELLEQASLELPLCLQGAP